MKKIFLILTFIVSIKLYAQETVIWGQNKTFAGKILKLYTFVDRITFEPTLLDSCLVDSSGNFSFHYKNNAISQVFIDLESQRGFLYSIPQKNYQVLLPDYTPIKLNDILNPYFQPQYIRLPIKNLDSNDLNYKIFLFDKYYDITINHLIIKQITNKDSVLYALTLLEKYIPKDTNTFYRNYKKYRYGFIKYSTYYKNKWKLAEEYFLHQIVLFTNPAYMSLFNNLFENCFSPLRNFFPTRTILYGLKEHNIQAMIDSFINLDTNINQDVATLIVLKGLHDLFYEIPYWQEDIIQTLTYGEKQITDSNLNLIARNILNKITSLREGYLAPNFTLPNSLGIKKTISSYRGKFIYLNFCHPQSLGCKEQLPLLKRYMEQAPDDFTIITILYGLNKKQYKDFIKKHKDYNWTILWGEYDKSILKKYKVVAFPTYYLIDPEGRLIKSPAPLPTENFEQIFSAIYKKWHLQHKTPMHIRTP